MLLSQEAIAAENIGDKLWQKENFPGFWKVELKRYESEKLKSRSCFVNFPFHHCNGSEWEFISDGDSGSPIETTITERIWSKWASDTALSSRGPA